jgi:hypothetical protein
METGKRHGARRWSAAAGKLALTLAMAGAVAGCNDVFDSKSCSVNGRLYEDGMTFIPAGDCNTCSCGPNGQVSCTTVACLPPAPLCSFDTSYTYGAEGGDWASQILGTLSPPASYESVVYTPAASPASVGCGPALPLCQDPTKLDVSDIMRDLLQGDVQAAFSQATPPIYGWDQRPVDGSIFGIHRIDGRGILVGSPCTNGPSVTGTCLDIPAGVQKLVDDLHALDQQQHADQACTAFSSAPTRQPAGP